MTDTPQIGRSVSIDMAATLLGVSRRTIYNRINEGKLQTIRTIGGSQRVLISSLVDLGFVEQQPFAPQFDDSARATKAVR